MLHPSFHRLLQLGLSLTLVACATTQQGQQEKDQLGTTTRQQAPLESEVADEMAPAGSVANVAAKPTAPRVRQESKELARRAPDGPAEPNMPVDGPPHNTEDYDRIVENPFLEVLKNPLSTFSIDVDTASYSNLRRMIEQGQKPPADAVRIEELVNYFPYRYPAPSAGAPFSISTDLADCPWAPGHRLLRVGLKGQPVDLQRTPPANLVFLLDVSGSMEDPNKLPLLKRSLKLVVDQMREQDTVAIVVYAGAAGQVLPPTSGSQREKILAALDELQAGGSTAGSAGIQLAYETAQKAFKPNGNNRVILATDGDFNVGPSSDGELVRLIEEKRKAGIFLTVLGFGMGNYKDNKMEKLADSGNGNYAYIDSLLEARKVLVQEAGGTLLTIAKDVKLQLEFNPTRVASYRLIGYENRLLAAEDFDDDSKDAGELGAGTTVTALYEVIPGSGSGHDLKYQQSTVKPEAQSGELVTLKLRYKQPQSDTSQLLSRVVEDKPLSWSSVPADFRFAAAVASYGMQLRGSEHRGSWGYSDVLSQARQGLGPDSEGYRASFLEMLQKSQPLLAQIDRSPANE
ncbi:MAG: vWA domain-containing protein [Candidatus Sericytochromatia bacterium]